MADPQQYLRLMMDGASFLLPGTVRYTMEQREGLVPNTADGSAVVGWRRVGNGRWPVYGLDGRLRPRLTFDSGWQRALFLEASPNTIGMVIDDAHLLPRGQVHIASFVPLGPAPTRLGHLFSGAWVLGRETVLVFEPGALVGYLQSLGE